MSTLDLPTDERNIDVLWDNLLESFLHHWDSRRAANEHNRRDIVLITTEEHMSLSTTIFKRGWNERRSN
jgi:hypothetical protein